MAGSVLFGIELLTSTPLQSLPKRPSCPWGAIGILCCVPKSMETGCPAKASVSCPSGLWGGPQSCPVSQACPTNRCGCVGASVLDRALGCGTFCGRGVSALLVRCYAFRPSTRTTLVPRLGLPADLSVCGGPCGADVAKECYLVDPASSHMLVSKIKPCMCKYELIQTVKLRMAH